MYFPYIHILLHNFICAASQHSSIPHAGRRLGQVVYFAVKDHVAPTVKDEHFIFYNADPFSVEIFILAVAVGRKCIRNIKSEFLNVYRFRNCIRTSVLGRNNERNDIRTYVGINVAWVLYNGCIVIAKVPVPKIRRAAGEIGK